MYIIGIGCILLFAVIYLYNRLIYLKNKVEEAFSGIDAALMKRYDLIHQMVEVVKGYAKYEKETLVLLTAVRSGMNIEEKNMVQDEMNRMKGQCVLLQEDYPQLKADAHFQQLQKSLIDVEEHLQAARRVYNANAARLNTLAQSFPGNMIAPIAHIEKQEYFSVQENEKEAVEVKL